MGVSHLHTYFLNRDVAYQTALAHHVVVLKNGHKEQQLCFYDGEPFVCAPKNLIHVPLHKFKEYFQGHSDRLPNHFNTYKAELSEDTKMEIAKRLNSYVKSV